MPQTLHGHVGVANPLRNCICLSSQAFWHAELTVSQAQSVKLFKQLKALVIYENVVGVGTQVPVILAFHRPGGLSAISIPSH